jgi:hypothetical protein
MGSDDDGAGALLVFVLIAVFFIIAAAVVLYWIWPTIVDVWADRVYGNDKNEYDIAKLENSG